MRIRLDTNVPVPLAHLLAGHVISTARAEGWERLTDTELLRAAVAAGFDCLLTCDQNIAHQQNLTAFAIRVVALDTISWALIRAAKDGIASALADFEHADARYRMIHIDRRSPP